MYNVAVAFTAHGAAKDEALARAARHRRTPHGAPSAERIPTRIDALRSAEGSRPGASVTSLGAATRQQRWFVAKWPSLLALLLIQALVAARAEAGAQEPPFAPPATETDLAPPPAPERATPPPVRKPQLSILSTKRQPNGTLIIELQVEAPSGGRIELQPTLDGQPINQFSLSQGRGFATASHYTMVLQPTRPDGVLTLVAKNGSVESTPALLRLRGGAAEHRPALYVLAVGVGNYESPDVPQLRYPAKDAADLAKTLRQQRDTLYRDVVVRVLSDKEATRSAVLSSLAWIASNAQPEDTSVIFFAGHGTNDPDGMYYYLPVDAQVRRETMISGALLQDGLRTIASRVILLLDTCHSGNVMGRRSFNRLINDLTTENRIVVFAASTGEQAARESSAWQNGAFTKALIEGLRGVADYQEDKQVSMSELETWASVRVNQLTSGVQTPTLAKPNAAPDYIVAALPEKGELPNPKQVLRRRVLWGGLGVTAGLIVILGLSLGLRSNSINNVVMPDFAVTR